MKYLILIIILFLVLFFYVKFLLRNDKNLKFSKYENLDDLYDEDGDFDYSSKGFSLKQNGTIKYFKWNDIIEINKWRIPILKHHQTILEIITLNQKVEINDNVNGWYKFTFQINENIPEIDKSWTLQNPDFAYELSSKKLNIYKSK